MADDSTYSAMLPEERRFRTVLRAVCLVASLYLCAFAILTACKAWLSHDIGTTWFAVWGTWAGGLATSSAFLITASNISVASARARADRDEAARIRENNAMAQARLLVIYKVETPDSIESLPSFRIENRSKDLFFDVTVPFVDSPNGLEARYERRTPELATAGNRLHEFIPSGELLTPYRSNTEHEAWFTLVTVHTVDWRGVMFAVEYTDAGGRRWRQHLGGKVEPIFTNEAVVVRQADRFQPKQQIRRLSDLEARRSGGLFARNLPPLQTDEEFLEVLEPAGVRHWKRIERVGEVKVRACDEDQPGQMSIEVTFAPPGPPFWKDHFRERLQQSRFGQRTGRANGRQESMTLVYPGDVESPGDVVDEAIQHANDRFEATELAAARRALEARLHRKV